MQVAGRHGPEAGVEMIRGRNKSTAIARETLPIGGVYIVFFRLRQPRRIRIGHLGFISFEPGIYAYVGSAQRNLEARLHRHGLRHKPLRWHIDYLSVKAEMLGAVVIEGPKSLECRLASMLAKHGAGAAAGFGCTECRCGAHLFRA